MAFIVGALLLTTIVVVGTLHSNRLLRKLGSLPFNPLLAPAENGLKLLLLALLVVLGRVSALPASAFGLRPLSPTDLGLGLAAGLAGWALSNLAATLAVARWGHQVISTVVIRAIVPRSPAQWLGALPAMALAVLLEEALFRAILLGGLGVWLPMALLVPATAVVFGLLHGIQGPLGVLVAGGMSVALALLFLASSSLWPPVLAHYCINIGQLVLAARRPDLLERS